MKTCTKCSVEKELTQFALQEKGRYGVTSVCKICTSQRGKDWHMANRERSIASKHKYNAANKDKGRAYGKRWRDENSERIKPISAAWAKNNLEKKAAATARRRAAKLQAIPSWASPLGMKRFYALAAWLTKTTGIKANVDHIIPLQSELVCGLHCEGNLTITTERQNKSKGNFHWPDMP